MSQDVENNIDNVTDHRAFVFGVRFGSSVRWLALVGIDNDLLSCWCAANREMFQLIGIEPQ